MQGDELLLMMLLPFFSLSRLLVFPSSAIFVQVHPCEGQICHVKRQKSARLGQIFNNGPILQSRPPIPAGLVIADMATMHAMSDSALDIAGLNGDAHKVSLSPAVTGNLCRVLSWRKAIT